MRNIIQIVSVILTIGCFSCNSSQMLVGQEEGWVLLTNEKVNHLTEKDVIKIDTRDKFTALRFYIKERDVEIKDLQITLINGDILKPAIEQAIKRDDRSRVIELGAEGRQLDNVRIRYRASGKIFSKKGIVLVAAKRYDPNGKF